MLDEQPPAGRVESSNPVRPSADRPWPAEPAQPLALNRCLDWIARPEGSVFGCRVPPYLGLGVAGIALGFAVLVVLGLCTRTSLAWLVTLSIAALATFLTAGLVRQAVGSKARHVLLEDVVLVLVVAGALAWALSAPMWHLLDLLVVGLGVFLVPGRLGCFSSGCCHGRPSPFGVRYVDADSVAGALLGIRLFPLQLVEASWIALVTAVSFVVVVITPPGTGMWSWLLMYGSGRFVLELARGDFRARRRMGLSPTQWLFLALVAARIGLEQWSAAAPMRALVGLGAAILVVAAAVGTRRFWLALPRPPVTAENVPAWERLVIDLEQHAQTAAPPPEATLTPSGARLALSLAPLDADRVLHAYSISGADRPAALGIAGFLLQRLPRHTVLRLGFQGAIFHLWVALEPHGVRGSSERDPAHVVADRALGFTHGLRHVKPVRLVPREPATAGPPASIRLAGTHVARHFGTSR